nr:hypothetical protein [Tanacetum cinerariifolium]
MADKDKKSTMKELATNDQANYYSWITSIKINGKNAYELKGKFPDDLHNNAFSGTNKEDAGEHIEYFLRIVDPIDLPNVYQDKLRVVFPISLVGDAWRCIGKGLFGPNGGRGRKVEVGFDDFRGGGRKLEIMVAMVEEEVPYLEEVEIAWREVGGVENKSLMGSMLIAKGEECLDGWVGDDEGEVKGGGVDLGVTKSLLGETPMESGDEEFRVDGEAV